MWPQLCCNRAIKRNEFTASNHQHGAVMVSFHPSICHQTEVKRETSLVSFYKMNVSTYLCYSQQGNMTVYSCNITALNPTYFCTSDVLLFA